MERLKGLDSKVLLRANMMGELSLGVETDLVFLNNVWTDLLPPQSGAHLFPFFSSFPQLFSDIRFFSYFV